MRHTADGALRRLLDEPAGVPDADRDHVAICDECLGRLATTSADAGLVHAALATDAGPDVDLEAAWLRLTEAAPAPRAAQTAAPAGVRRVRAARPPRARRARTAGRRPVVAGVAVAAVLASAGVAAANDWLPIFETERIAPVSIGIDDLNALPDLEAYGDVVVTGYPNVHPVPDAAAAAAETGLDVPEPAGLPDGVSGEPRYVVGGEASVTFTFSADRAAEAAAEAAEPLPPPPPGLDGSRVRLVAGPAVAAIWSESAGGPDLVVGRATAPRAFSSAGLSFETLRDYLLSLPGLPPEIAAQLRTFDDDTTFPLPVPSDRVTTSSAQVDGVEATVLETRDRSLAGVVWAEDGVVTVVAGPLDADEVLTVARSLR
jgi:hypothetical protein